MLAHHYALTILLYALASHLCYYSAAAADTCWAKLRLPNAEVLGTTSVACDASGKSVATTCMTYNNGFKLAQSDDFGASWYSTHGFPRDDCVKVISDHSGQFLAAVCGDYSNGPVFVVSPDKGVHWRVVDMPKDKIVQPSMHYYMYTNGSAQTIMDYKAITFGRQSSTLYFAIMYHQDDNYRLKLLTSDHEGLNVKSQSVITEISTNSDYFQTYLAADITGQYVYAAFREWYSGTSIFVSSDYGVTWERTFYLHFEPDRIAVFDITTTIDGSYVEALFCLTNGDLSALGYNCNWLVYSYDYGRTWTMQDLATSRRYNTVNSTSGEHIYSVLSGGLFKATKCNTAPTTATESELQRCQARLSTQISTSNVVKYNSQELRDKYLV